MCLGSTLAACVASEDWVRPLPPRELRLGCLRIIVARLPRAMHILDRFHVVQWVNVQAHSALVKTLLAHGDRRPSLARHGRVVGPSPGSCVPGGLCRVRSKAMVAGCKAMPGAATDARKGSTASHRPHRRGDVIRSRTHRIPCTWDALC